MNVYDRVNEKKKKYIYIYIYIYLTFAFGFNWTVGNISLGIETYDRSIVVRQARVQLLVWHPKTFLYPFSEKMWKKSKRRDGSRAKKISQSILGMPQKLWNESWNKFKINISCVTYVNICLFLFQNLAGQFIDRGIWGSRSKVEFFPEGHPRRWEVTLNPFVSFMMYSFLTHVPEKESGLVQVNNFFFFFFFLFFFFFFFFFFSVSRPLDKSNFSKISENSARSPV